MLLLQNHDTSPRPGQEGGRRRAARAAADDHRIVNRVRHAGASCAKSRCDKRLNPYMNRRLPLIATAAVLLSTLFYGCVDGLDRGADGRGDGAALGGVAGVVEGLFSPPLRLFGLAGLAGVAGVAGVTGGVFGWSKSGRPGVVCRPVGGNTAELLVPTRVAVVPKRSCEPTPVAVLPRRSCVPAPVAVPPMVPTPPLAASVATPVAVVPMLVVDVLVPPTVAPFV